MSGEILHRDDRTRDAALSWIARLRSEASSEQDTQAFALWLSEDESHRLAMDNMLEMWDDLGSVKKLPFGPAYTDSAANQRNWLAASVAMAACLVLAFFLWPQIPDDSRLVEFKTAMGERQSYELEDRSMLILNTDSKASVTYNSSLRHVDLVRGEAYFEVAKDIDRPFEVNIGSAMVTALGTAFNIYRSGESATITVTEGVVRVTELGINGNRAPATEILRANEYLTATEEGFKGAASSVDVAQSIAWKEGRLIADEMPLYALIAQLERYQDIHIIIGTADIAALTVSGVFELEEPKSVLRALELSHELTVVELDSRTLQLLKASQ